MDSKKYSQGDQDIITNDVFKKIGTTNKFCVEFGFNSNSLTGGSGSNTANLILNEGWDSILLDGDFENKEINLYKEYLTPENICQIFRKYNVPIELDYLSIDVDSMDLWLLDAVLKEYSPRLVSVEYNANYSIDEAITFPNDTNQRWEIDKGYGASLKALKLAADKYNYHLIGVETMDDCFFIHNDLKDHFDILELSELKDKCLLDSHPPLINPERHKLFLDYEVYLETNGDVKKSQQAAEEITKKRLTNNKKFVGNEQKNLNKEEVGALLTAFYKKQSTHKSVVPPFLEHTSISNDSQGLGDTVILTPFISTKHVRSDAPSFSTLIKYHGGPCREYNWHDSPPVVNISEYAKYNWGGGHAIQRIARALGLPEICKPQGVLDSLKPTPVANRIGYHVDRGTQKYTSLSSKALRIFDSCKGHHEEYEWYDLASFTDTTNIEGLIDFLSTCEYFIGINSGLMHLAAAIGIKSIIIVNQPSPELLYLPKIKEAEIHELEWLYPQNVHLHTQGFNELVPLFNEGSLVDALNGKVYPYFKDDFLDIKML